MGRAAALLVTVGILIAGCAQAEPTSSGVESLFSTSEDLVVVARCLADRGWDAELKDGAIVVDVPEAQKDVYQKDSLECWREAGVDPDGSLAEEDYRAIYEWYGEIADCLSGAGWSVPTTPSFETFRAEYDSTPWIPWAEVPETDMGRATEVCPVMNVPNH